VKGSRQEGRKLLPMTPANPLSRYQASSISCFFDPFPHPSVRLFYPDSSQSLRRVWRSPAPSRTPPVICYVFCRGHGMCLAYRIRYDVVVIICPNAASQPHNRTERTNVSRSREPEGEYCALRGDFFFFQRTAQEIRYEEIRASAIMKQKICFSLVFFLVVSPASHAGTSTPPVARG